MRRGPGAKRLSPGHRPWLRARSRFEESDDAGIGIGVPAARNRSHDGCAPRNHHDLPEKVCSASFHISSRTKTSCGASGCRPDTQKAWIDDGGPPGFLCVLTYVAYRDMFERRDENLPNQVMALQISGAVELGHVEDLFGWPALKQTYATGGNGFSRPNAKTAVAHGPYRPQITIAQHSTAETPNSKTLRRLPNLRMTVGITENSPRHFWHGNQGKPVSGRWMF